MKRSREPASVLPRILRPILIGVLVGVIAGVLLLLAAAAVMASTQLPTGIVSPIALAVIAVAALVGGFTAARLSRERGLLYGAGCGLLIFLVVAIAGFSVVPSSQGAMLLLKLALTVGGGALGGVLGVNVKRK